MFAGKTRKILELVSRAAVAKQKVAVVKYGNDVRYSDKPELVCHDQTMRLAATFVCTKLADVMDKLWEFDVVILDEVAFMTDAVEHVDRLLQHGCAVAAAGLSSDYRREPFPVMSRLSAQAEKEIKLTAVCMGCQGKAHLTRKIANLESTSIEDIGGADKYQAVCRKCYFKTTPTPDEPNLRVLVAPPSLKRKHTEIAASPPAEALMSQVSLEDNERPAKRARTEGWGTGDSQPNQAGEPARLV